MLDVNEFIHEKMHHMISELCEGLTNDGWSKERIGRVLITHFAMNYLCGFEEFTTAYHETAKEEQLRFLQTAISKVLKESYPNEYNEETRSCNVIVEPYMDDEISLEKVKSILESNDPRMTLIEYLNTEMYEDALSEESSKIVSAVWDEIWSDENFADSVEITDEDLYEAVYEQFSCEINEKFFLKKKYPVNIFLDTGDGNYDYTCNDLDRYDSAKEFPEVSSILWLCGQQGYSVEQVAAVISDAEASNIPEDGFLGSVRREIYNASSSMLATSFLCEMTLDNLIDLNVAIHAQERHGRYYDASQNPYCGTITLGTKTETGLYDLWYGCGSVLEIELEKPVEIPIKYIRSALPDGCDGYSIARVYGVTSNLWRDTLQKLDPINPFATVFIDHYYVVEDLQIRGVLNIEKFTNFEDAMTAYLALPKDKLKAMGVEKKSNPLPGCLDMIQCVEGQDKIIQDYLKVDGWSNSEILDLIEKIQNRI